jgi:quercetin dioxygenase-like cupin family protein
MFMSVVQIGFGQVDDALVSARWSKSKDMGAAAPLGVAAVGHVGDDVGFLITTTPLNGPDVLGCEPVSLPFGGWALRVDEVAFPVGAIAHRHTHSGSGWRYLVSGALRIETDHETSVMQVEDCWFEPAGSPVRAVAMQDSGVTRFVRCMVIPLNDVGRSTFKLHRPEDADLPRLQMTHRHFDHIVQDDAG